MGLPSTEDFRDWLLGVIQEKLTVSETSSDLPTVGRPHSGTAFLRKDPRLISCDSVIQVNLADGRSILITFQRLHNQRKRFLDDVRRRQLAKKVREVK